MQETLFEHAREATPNFDRFRCASPAVGHATSAVRAGHSQSRVARRPMSNGQWQMSV